MAKALIDIYIYPRATVHQNVYGYLLILVNWWIFKNKSQKRETLYCAYIFVVVDCCSAAAILTRRANSLDNTLDYHMPACLPAPSHSANNLLPVPEHAQQICSSS